MMSLPHQVHLKAAFVFFVFVFFLFQNLTHVNGKIPEKLKRKSPQCQTFLVLGLGKEGTEKLQEATVLSPYDSFFLGLPVVSAEQSLQSGLCF